MPTIEINPVTPEVVTPTVEVNPVTPEVETTTEPAPIEINPQSINSNDAQESNVTSNVEEI